MQYISVVDGGDLDSLHFEICLEYDSTNATVQKFEYTVDWNQEVQKCIANALTADSLLVDYAVEKLMDDYITEYNNTYRTACMNRLTEDFTYTYIDKEYHYTLYYYDQAKNLVQTVPPAGVHPLASTEVQAFLKGADIEPTHSLKTFYRYSSLNQLLAQETPDAGESNFYYNVKGQLRLSQNAQQYKDDNYSYSKYDEQGRVIEVGEFSTVESSFDVVDSLELRNFPTTGLSNYAFSDVTRTHYDFAKPSLALLFPQQYLRSRVSWVEVIEKDATDTIATFYSYDLHGNVKSLAQDQPGLGLKRTDYRYDLISGKVNYVFYQYGKSDQFTHRYTYDSDNRLTKVQTSSDRFVWYTDAQYYYYLHGPLARVELGEYRSQGTDYSYTLQGWIKGVNKTFGVEPAEEDFNVGKDVFAYSLGYYDGDYAPVNSSVTSTDDRDHLWTRLDESFNHNGLYNGNISWMVTDLSKIGEINNDRQKGMQGMLYKYDQLHRITKSRSLTGYSEANGFSERSAPGPYDETYTYDGNGNILTLDRLNGAGQPLHDYEYNYYKETNKLRGVLPITRDTLYNGAINSNAKLYRDVTVSGTARPQSGTPSAIRATRNIEVQNGFEAEEAMDFAAYIPEDGPFIYDAIGNLTADEEEGSKISWTAYGK